MLMLVPALVVTPGSRRDAVKGTGGAGGALSKQGGSAHLPLCIRLPGPGTVPPWLGVFPCQEGI